MKSKLLIPIAFLIFCGTIITVLFHLEKQTLDQLPAPTTGETIVKEGAEDGDNQQKREAWFDLMHQAAPGTNWKSLEYQTQMQRHKKRSEIRSKVSNRSTEEILANGNLIGEWKERGSRDQSGSVFVTEFDEDTEEIYLVSAGGTLWKGTLQGTDWKAINQDFKFGNKLLSFIPTDTGRRLVATIGDIPHFSDDDGITWTSSSGIPGNASGIRSRKFIVLDNDESTIYLLSKPGYWSDLKLYKSSDKGETYTSIQQLEDFSFDRYTLCKPHGTNEVFILDRHNGEKTSIYKINQNNDELDLLVQNDSFGFGNIRANLIGIQQDTTTSLLIYNADLDCLFSSWINCYF